MGTSKGRNPNRDGRRRLEADVVASSCASGVSNRDGRRRLEADVVAAFTETAHLLDRKEIELEGLREFKLRAQERIAAQEEHIASLMSCLATKQREEQRETAEQIAQQERQLKIQDGVTDALQDKLLRIRSEFETREKHSAQQVAELEAACNAKVAHAEARVQALEQDLSTLRNASPSPPIQQLPDPSTEAALSELVQALQLSHMQLQRQQQHKAMSPQQQESAMQLQPRIAVQQQQQQSAMQLQQQPRIAVQQQQQQMTAQQQQVSPAQQALDMFLSQQQATYTTPQLTTTYATPQQATYTSPQQAMYTSSQQATYATPQQATYATPQQAMYTSPQQATYAAPQQATYPSPQQATYAVKSPQLALAAAQAMAALSPRSRQLEFDAIGFDELSAVLEAISVPLQNAVLDGVSQEVLEQIPFLLQEAAWE